MNSSRRARTPSTGRDNRSNLQNLIGAPKFIDSSRGPQTSQFIDAESYTTTKLKEKAISKTESERNEFQWLPKYNSFSRPKPSKVLPLRTVFLDPSVNNIPPSKTRSELINKLKLTSTPHPSYDLDNDGYVSQEDFRLSKQIDLEGTGALDPDERRLGKVKLADQFFRKHSNELEKYGGGFASRPHEENVQSIAESVSFERAYDRLKSLERSVSATSSASLLPCIVNPDPSLTRHNFYTDKFDSTAWNDFDAIPRSASQYGLRDHGGSRKRLLFSRNQTYKEKCVSELEKQAQAHPPPHTRRLALITNVSFENG